MDMMFHFLKSCLNAIFFTICIFNNNTLRLLCKRNCRNKV